jgi:hypothetical protein
MLKSEESFHHQSVCVLNIRVSVWCVNSCFKELFVLKVTSTLICLNRFVMCLIPVLTCESYIFVVPYFTQGYLSDFPFMCVQVQVAHRQIVHTFNYINRAILFSDGLCISVFVWVGCLHVYVCVYIYIYIYIYV